MGSLKPMLYNTWKQLRENSENPRTFPKFNDWLRSQGINPNQLEFESPKPKRRGLLGGLFGRRE